MCVLLLADIVFSGTVTMDSPAIVETTPSLTKDFLEDVLRKNFDDPGITLDFFEIQTSNTKGDNYASIIQRVAVTYRDGKSNQGKKYLLVKSLPAGEIMQTYLKEMCLFDKEISAYSKLIPAMRRLTEMPILCPQFYTTDRENTVILEDLSHLGFKMADRRKRLDLDHSFLALKALARFHALTYGVVQRDPDILDLFPEATSDRLKEMDAKIAPKMYEDLASIIGTWPGYERFSDKLLSVCDELQERQEKCLVPKNGAFNVLNHGDFWVNNMLFRYNEDTQNVEDVCMIDLQALRYTSPTVDLQYFLASSLADGIRDEHEDHLLEVYHEELTKTLESVGVDSSIYSLDDLKKDYDEKAPVGFIDGIEVLGAVSADPSEAYDFESITEESLEDGSADPLGKTFRGMGFKDVFQKHLLYYEKKGIL